MPDDEKNETLRPKDLLFLAPVLASSVAITWEVGKFWRVGGFYYFSFSEHLVAATANLPIALFSVIYFGIFLVPAIRFINKNSPVKPLRTRDKILLGIVALSTLASYGVSYYFGVSRDFSAPVLTIILFGFVSNVIWFQYRLNSAVMLGASFGALIVLTLAMSADLWASLLQDSQKIAERVAVITTKTEKINGMVIMSGERGVLIYRPDLKRVMFQRADEIRSVEWPY